MNRSGIAERRLHCVAIGLDCIRKRRAPRGFQVRYHDHDHAPARWGPRHEDPFGRAFDHPQALHGRVIGLDGPTLHVTRVCPRPGVQSSRRLTSCAALGMIGQRRQTSGALVHDRLSQGRAAGDMRSCRSTHLRCPLRYSPVGDVVLPVRSDWKYRSMRSRTSSSVRPRSYAGESIGCAV